MSRRVVLPALGLAGWLAIATFPQWSKDWESSRYATGILRDILIFAIFAGSLDLLVGRAGLPSLGHAAFFGGGAYAAAIVGQRLGTNELLVGLGAAIAVAGLLALIIGSLAVRAVGIFFLMLTLALAQMVYALAYQATDLTGGSNGFAGVRRPALLGFDLASAEALYLMVAVVFLLTTLLLWRIAHSPYGRALAGLRENERRMRALGYDTRTLKLTVFVLAGALAGIAGALSAYAARFVSPNDVALGTSVTGLVMVLIGGAGMLLGPLLGAAAVLLIERVLSSSIGFSQSILGIVFVLFVVFARGGLAGLIRDAFGRNRS